MVAVIGNITPQLGLVFPGYISPSENVKFSDIGGGLQSLTKIPQFGVLQILAFAGIMELFTWKQRRGMAPGDVGGKDWVRYQDEELKVGGMNKLEDSERCPSPLHLMSWLSRWRHRTATAVAGAAAAAAAAAPSAAPSALPFCCFLCFLLTLPHPPAVQA